MALNLRTPILCILLFVLFGCGQGGMKARKLLDLSSNECIDGNCGDGGGGNTTTTSRTSTTSTTTTIMSGPTGQQLFATHCASCHTPAQKSGRTPAQIQNAINGNPASAWPSMNTSSLHALTTSNIQSISAYLGGFTPTTTTTSTSGFNTTTSQTTTSSTTTTTGTVVLDGSILFQNHCRTCHAPEDKRGRSAIQIRTAINTITPQMSSRPDLQALTNPQLEGLESYLMSLHGAPTTLDAIAPTGTAYHSADSLKKVFLPAPGDSGYDAINTKINSYVKSRNTVFGHPCTRYDNPDFGDNSVCADAELGPIAPILPVTSAVRKGFLIRTCTELVARNPAVETALSRAGLSVNSPVTFDNVRLLYTFIYHGRLPTNAAINALVNIGTAAGAMSGHDKWRFILLPLCEANNGEIL